MKLVLGRVVALARLVGIWDLVVSLIPVRLLQLWQAEKQHLPVRGDSR